MLKIRLLRIGAKSRPFYRIVAVDQRKKRSGGYIDLLGTYNPLTEPKDIKINQEKLEEWKKKGAVLSDGVLRILGQAPGRPPRKPKKEPKAPKETSVAAPVEETAPEEDTESGIQNTEESAESVEATETLVETPSEEATEEPK